MEQSVAISALYEFSRSIYMSLQDGTPKNMFLSPLSISLSLAMTLVGADGDTRKQILLALTLNDSSYELLLKTHQYILEKLRKNNEQSVSISNRLFVDQDQKISDEFLNTLDSVYNSTCVTVPFLLDSVAAASEINSWAKRATNDKIKTLVSPDELTPNTALLIGNAVYFKSSWALRFSADNTKVEDFSLLSGEKIKVNMMFQSKKFKIGYLNDIDCDVIELPYTDETLKMVVFLPRELDGINKVETNFSIDIINKAEEIMHSRKVDLWMPKFKLEGSYRLKSALQNLGVSDPFVPGVADFTLISGNRDLFISSVIHKTFVDVNEEGTEAAAVTGVMICKRSIVFPETFKANHPFLFSIIETTTKQLLFLGSLKVPEAVPAEDYHDEL